MSRARSFIFAGLLGALFGAGLLISGMTQPAKVIGFLDPTRHWDPSLAFVMAGAAGVYAILFRVIRRRERPWLGIKFHVPAHGDVDLPLVAGAAGFGIGWGLGGFCPGPGIVAAAAGSSTAIAFVVAMLVGMYAQHRIAKT